MVDIITSEQRSKLMSRVRNKDTKPELVVRSTIHNMGYRFRLHRHDLSGKPDIVFPKYHKVIFVHGCFWHQHQGCPDSKRPSSNINFWNKKLESNIERDKRNIDHLKQNGWDVFVVWECETKNLKQLITKLGTFLKRM